ncbi:MAG: serine/threonine protein kinase [Planctomycetota bacterium]|jgi:serine/threonine protein kinase
MISDRRKRAEDLFQVAVDLAATDQATFLQQQCGSDAALRADVDVLLRTYETDLGDFLRTAVVSERADPGEQPGDCIGPYKLLSRIGQGAFGDVYVAEQAQPVRRTVALKIVKLGMDTKQVVARFEAERQALALMDHPHIAKVYDAGATELGRPYFVMELVPGRPITEYCDEQRLPIKLRLRLFLEVCDAIQHAHQKGIIHRDVKPSNIIVELVGDRAVPKVIDFGIAKATGYSLTERTLFTDHGQLIGTPEYMSPEQAEVSGRNVDTRTDIYSLGVVLYELMTGTLPFEPTTLRSGTIDEIQRKIRQEHPAKPSTRVRMLGDGAAQAAKCRRTNLPSFRRRLRHDLDWIIMKAMDKDQTRRYGTSSELVADIQRHLRHEPVVAGPPSTSYRLRKLVRRNRPAVIATVVVLIGLIWGTVASVGLFRERNEAQAEAIRRIEAERQAIEERDRARRAVSLALTLILEWLGSSEAEVSPAILDDMYEALTQTYGKPAAGKEETIRHIVQFALAARLLSQDRAAEAEVILVPLKDWVDVQFGSLNAGAVLVRELLAEARIELGKYAEAEPVAEETYQSYLELYGPQAPRTRNAKNRLIELYEAWGKPAKAAEWRAKGAPSPSPSEGGEGIGLPNS